VFPASRGGSPPFDWAEPATWPPVVAGATSMFLMAPDGVAVDEEFVAVAVDAGMRRIVLLSSLGIEEMRDERLLAAERVVAQSGADYTVVRSDWFDQNFSEGFLQPAVLGGSVAIPVGDHRFAFTHCDDLAEVIAASLTTHPATGETLSASGPRAMDFAAATRIIAEASGRPVVFRGGAQDYIEAMTGFGVPEGQARADADAFEALRVSPDSEPTSVIADLTGHEPRSLESFAAEAARHGAWAG
jgi:uncharacterized protein YbjT (DUF2867 family)